MTMPLYWTQASSPDETRYDSVIWPVFPALLLVLLRVRRMIRRRSSDGVGLEYSMQRLTCGADYWVPMIGRWVGVCRVGDQ
jgi:hypothetical protein